MLEVCRFVTHEHSSKTRDIVEAIISILFRNIFRSIGKRLIGRKEDGILVDLLDLSISIICACLQMDSM